MSLRAEHGLTCTTDIFVSLWMLPNVLISLSLKKRHMTALKNTARTTVLQKYHWSCQYATYLTNMKLKHSFCAPRYIRRYFYLHIDARLGSHANTQTASWFAFFFWHTTQLHRVIGKTQHSCFKMLAAFIRLEKPKSLTPSATVQAPDVALPGDQNSVQHVNPAILKLGARQPCPSLGVGQNFTCITLYS